MPPLLGFGEAAATFDIRQPKQLREKLYLPLPQSVKRCYVSAAAYLFFAPM